MSRLISQTNSYNLEFIKNTNDFLIFTKNFFRVLEKHEAFNDFSEEIIIPVRWSRTKSSAVIDFCTNKYRDIDGINLSNINKEIENSTQKYDACVNILNAVNNNEKFNMLCKNFHLDKNEFKYIIFVSKESMFFPIGLYKRCETKKRRGICCKQNIKTMLFDNNIKTLVKISDSCKNFKSLQTLKLKTSYTKIYSDYLSELKSLSFALNIDNMLQHISFDNIVNSSINIERKSTRKEVRNLIENLSAYTFEKNKSSIIRYFLFQNLYEYIQKILAVNNGVCYYDKNLFKFINIKDLNKEHSVQNNSLNFKEKEYDNFYMFPKVF